MTKSEFIEWRDSLATQEIYTTIRASIAEGRDELEAGCEPLYAAKVVGKLAAYRAILDISFEDPNDN